jgi:hypothetical protein
LFGICSGRYLANRSTGCDRQQTNVGAEQPHERLRRAISSEESAQVAIQNFYERLPEKSFDSFVSSQRDRERQNHHPHGSACARSNGSIDHDSASFGNEAVSAFFGL